MTQHRTVRLLPILLLWLLGTLLVVACGGSAALVSRSPRWACPSPLPKPWGPSGPVKSTNTISHDGELVTENTYYEEWEQEYGALGGPPFPSPTPYALVGTSYGLGQRVEIWPFHVTVTAAAGAPVVASGIPTGTQQLYLVTLDWVNHATGALPMDYATRVQLQAVTRPDGRVQTDTLWGMTALALELSGLPAPPSSVPPGSSRVTIPIIGPVGQPKTVGLAVIGNPNYQPTLPTSTTGPGTPTPSPFPTGVATTPTPNTDLRSDRPQELAIQWSAGRTHIGGAPPCGDAGALTSWGNDDQNAWGSDLPVAGVAAPPGADRVIQIAMQQQDKPYVWGAKGPNAFDCSGLMTWAYAQIGIRIPQGTAGQVPGMRPVSQAEIKPGDLIFFAIGGGEIDHVGMLIGDINGNGQWDLLHAASPKLGIRIDYDIFTKPGWTKLIRAFRTAR